MAKDKQELNHALQRYKDVTDVIKTGMPSSTESERRSVHSQAETLKDNILRTPRSVGQRKLISIPKSKRSRS